jgi:putative ABC transport system substrate-binding protein
MKRRDFVGLVVAATAVCPIAAPAQPSKIPMIAVLVAGAVPADRTDAFLRSLEELGLRQGRDFDLIFRSTETDQSRAQGLIAELLALHPAVVVTQTTGLTLDVKRASASVPIVSLAMTDPIGLGLAVSFARPGGNVTGLTAATATRAKQLQLLLETVPGIRRVGVLNNPANAGNVVAMQGLRSDTAALPISLVEVEARMPSDIEPAFQRLASEGVDALLVGQDQTFVQEARLIAELALNAKLPSVNGFRIHADAGGLLSYGSSQMERWQLVARYVAKILSGAKVADLPIEQQAKLELVINLKTAKALGITVPPSILARADEVIE